MDTLSSTIVIEKLWRADPGIGSAIGSRGFGSNMIPEFGSERMKEEWFTCIANGESTCASVISEPAHGSNVAGTETRAEHVRSSGNTGDEFVINGNKAWITNSSPTSPSWWPQAISLTNHGITARTTDRGIERYLPRPRTSHRLHRTLVSKTSVRDGESGRWFAEATDLQGSDEEHDDQQAQYRLRRPRQNTDVRDKPAGKPHNEVVDP